MPVPTNRPPFQPSYPGVPLSPPVADPSTDLDLIHILKILKRRALVVGGAALTVTAAIWAWTATQTPIYRGEFRVLVESAAEVSPSQQLLAEAGRMPTTDYDTQIEVLRSQALLSPVAQALQQQYPEIDSRILAANLSINRVRDTKILAVAYQGTDPDIIQAILEEVSQQFLDYSFEQRQVSLQQGVDFVDGQLPELRERVDSLQARLERFRQQYSLFDPESRGGDLSGLLSSVEAQRQDLQSDLAQARSLFQTLQSQLGTSPSDALASAALSESSRYQSLLTQIKDLEAQIAVDSARYQPDSPQIEALEEKRDNLLPLLEQQASQTLGGRVGASADSNLTPTSLDLSRQLIEVANQIETLQARSQSLAQVEQNLKQEFELVPSLSREYTELQRELGVATQSLNRFLETRETLQIDAAQKSVPWELIARPQTSSRPISPDVSRNITLGVVAGLLLGVAAALLMEKLDQVFHSTEELKSATKLPVLGTIPYLPELQRQAPFLGRVSEGPQNQQSRPEERASFRGAMFFEGFRSLYTSIRFVEVDQAIGSVVVTSAIPGEGKSTVAVGLAHAAAAMGQRVLLVDADLRAPRQHTHMGLPNYHGLSNVISDAAEISAAIQQSSLDPNLSVLTAGTTPPDPVKLLSSQRMETIMQQLQQAYDFVVYDTPPTSGFTDSSLLAAHAGGLVLVVGLGKTERSLVEQTLERLERLPISLLGLVANGIKQYTTQLQRHDQYYQYYQTPAASAAPAPSPPVAASSQIEPSGSSFALRSGAKAYSASTSISNVPVKVDNPAPNFDPSPDASSSSIAIASETRLGWPWFAVGLASVAMLTVICSIALIRIANNRGMDGEETLDLSDSPAEVEDSAGADAALPAPEPNAADPNDTRATDQAPTGEPTPRPNAAFGANVVAQDPFEEAVQVAQDAVSAGNEAQTPQEWSQITDLWQRASALMAVVPEDDPRFELARDRSVTYRSNGEYARQRTLSLQLESR